MAFSVEVISGASQTKYLSLTDSDTGVEVMIERPRANLIRLGTEPYIEFYDYGEKTFKKMVFQDFGDIDGDIPTSIEDAYSLIKALILANFNPASGGSEAAGSDKQVQYNNAGSLAGATKVEIQENELTLSETIEATAPAPNKLKVFMQKLAGNPLLITENERGTENFIQNGLYKTSLLWVKPIGNSTSVSTFGVGALSITGTASSIAVATTNLSSQLRKVEYVVTTPATNAVAGWRIGSTQFFRGNASPQQGGYFFVCRWCTATGTATATTRACVGMHNNQLAPTDVEPSTFINHISMGWDAADANVQVMHNDGSGTSTKIDLGASFPVPTVDRTDVYELALYCPPGSTTVFYQVINMVSAVSVSGSITTDVPASSTLISPRGWMSVGGTSSVIGIGLISIYVETKD